MSKTYYQKSQKLFQNISSLLELLQLQPVFEIITCLLVRDNRNNHWTSRNEGGSCLMDKQEAIPHKLLFSRKGTNHTN